MPPGTSYITPAMLLNAPTGVAWSLIPEPKSGGTAAQWAEVTNICWRATSIVDTYCNQVLRATVDNEVLTGPGSARFGVQPGTGNSLLVMRRWPVINVLAVQLARNTFPRVWSTVPAGQYEPQRPLINQFTDSASATMPDGGSGIVLARGWVDRCYGRNGYQAWVSYANGWPHTSLTAAASAGATTVQVDDVTGWPGAAGFVYDGAETESMAGLSVAASSPLQLPNGVGTAQAGPGTLTLAAPLTYPHPAGTVVSALPANVLWATVLAAAAQALESGITSVTIQNVSGSSASSGHGVSDLTTEYEVLLDPFRRIV